VNHDVRRIRVNGRELNVLIAGEGPDVLLVHGFPDDHTVWRRQIGPLVAAGYRVIAPDTRGCGDSEMPPRVRDYHLDVLVADLVALLDMLRIDKVRLIGHDWGAVQGWQLAIRHPERVERYIALSVGHPGAYARAGLGQKLRAYYVLLAQLRGLIELVIRSFGWHLFAMFSGYPEEMPRWRQRLSRPGRLTAGLNYYRANLHLLFAGAGLRVRVPVVGIYSSGDRFLVERQMRESAQYCDAGWQYVRLDGANHWLQLSAADALNPLLLRHLA
jgi:pimeloyl-ACP methyl ester carboxylesterase